MFLQIFNVGESYDQDGVVMVVEHNSADVHVDQTFSLIFTVIQRMVVVQTTFTNASASPTKSNPIINTVGGLLGGLPLVGTRRHHVPANSVVAPDLIFPAC